MQEPSDDVSHEISDAYGLPGPSSPGQNRQKSRNEVRLSAGRTLLYDSDQ